MNKKYWGLALGFLLSVFLLTRGWVDREDHLAENQKATDVNAGATAQKYAAPAQQVKHPLHYSVQNGPFAAKTAALMRKRSHLRKDELQALQRMTDLLAEFSHPRHNTRDLVLKLQQFRQDPFIDLDRNQVTGDMTIVRTNSPMPGTRYFHAQIFSGQGVAEFVQHVSFEFRPDSGAMLEAISALQHAFPQLGAPSESQADFVKWNLPGNYVVWVKRLNKIDIDNNPFNAYTTADIGSVRVAVELNQNEG